MNIKIYTDGACSNNPGPGGWACILQTLLNNGQLYEIKKSGGFRLTTNNRMELRAVIEAFRIIVAKEKKSQSKHEYDIYSDSAYVVNTINNHWIEAWQKNNWQTTKREDVKNKDLWEQFSKLRAEANKLGISITLNKIKGHSGNTFNELVDKLAKEESMKAKVNNQ